MTNSMISTLITKNLSGVSDSEIDRGLTKLRSGVLLGRLKESLTKHSRLSYEPRPKS